ncbi:hypothetical protein CRUP_029636 [Coryphaenoides rupestris]|nr:hypothetical protein CRUP_029636 [Coryphaenoides rupestris]
MTMWSEEEKESRKKRVRPLFRHFRRIDACLQPREAFRGSDEIFCRVYTPDHSYVTIRSRLSCRVGEILALLPLPEEIHWSPGDSKLHDMSAEEVANQLVVFDWELFSCVHEVEFVCYVFHGEQARWRPLNLELVLQRCSEVQHWVATEILQCQSLPKRVQLLRKFIKIASLCKQQQDLLSFLAVVLGLDNPAVSRLRLTWELPLPEEIHWSPGDSKLHDMSAEEVANQLVVFDWELFSCVHEVEFVCYVFHGEQARWRPLNLELVLQRCSEVQHWVATEILQCQSLPKRVQLPAQVHQDRLAGLPGKFRKQFQQFEGTADPSRNHKSYRDLMASLRPPLIPFTPLLLKDLTFLHESCKTFHGEMVNFEKMHKVAEMVRTIRRYRSTPLVMETEPSPSHLQTKAEPISQRRRDPEPETLVQTLVLQDCGWTRRTPSPSPPPPPPPPPKQQCVSALTTRVGRASFSMEAFSIAP